MVTLVVLGLASKGDTQTFDTKEDALAALDAAQKKLKSMTDLAFGISPLQRKVLTH